MATSSAALRARSQQAERDLAWVDQQLQEIEIEDYAALEQRAQRRRQFDDLNAKESAAVIDDETRALRKAELLNRRHDVLTKLRPSSSVAEEPILPPTTAKKRKRRRLSDIEENTETDELASNPRANDDNGRYTLETAMAKAKISVRSSQSVRSVRRPARNTTLPMRTTGFQQSETSPTKRRKTSATIGRRETAQTAQPAAHSDHSGPTLMELIERERTSRNPRPPRPDQALSDTVLALQNNKTGRRSTAPISKPPRQSTAAAPPVSSKYPTVVETNGKLHELSCKICGANATSGTLPHFFKSSTALKNHIYVHKGEDESTIKPGDMDLCIRKRPLSTVDAKRVRADQEPIEVKIEPRPRDMTKSMTVREHLESLIMSRSDFDSEVASRPPPRRIAPMRGKSVAPPIKLEDGSSPTMGNSKFRPDDASTPRAKRR